MMIEGRIGDRKTLQNQTVALRGRSEWRMFYATVSEIVRPTRPTRPNFNGHAGFCKISRVVQAVQPVQI
jgi:hypothetical protein